MAAFPDMLRTYRERNGFTVGQAAWRVGVKPEEYRELEAGTGSPSWETWDQICKLFGWPQTFAGTRWIGFSESLLVWPWGFSYFIVALAALGILGALFIPGPWDLEGVLARLVRSLLWGVIGAGAVWTIRNERKRRDRGGGHP